MADETNETEDSGGIWYRIKKMAGQCAANDDLEDLKASVESAKGSVDKALMGGRMLQGKSGAFDKLTKANEGLGVIGDVLKKVKNVCVDVKAIGKIHDAIITLSDDRIIYDDPQAAADAFDSLFNGLGRLCRFLPSPADEWGEFFSRFNLFGNMQRNVFQPYFEKRYNASNYR